MLLGLELNCKNLLLLIIKIEWVENHSDGHENGGDPYSFISLRGLCIAFAFPFCVLSIIRDALWEMEENVCAESRKHTEGQLFCRGGKKTLSCCICGIKCNYYHPLCEQSLLLSECIHTGISVSTDDSTENIYISYAAIRSLCASASGLV